MRLILLLIAITPLGAHAAVTLSEVAWMGSADSANHEWIELHNSGTSAVDLAGWTITDGMNLSIDLAGSIAAGEYVVLERTSDESAPGNAFLIYTGALVNSGATLQLRRADGSLEDQVAGGDNWEQIGGDNTTKETAQYTTSGWITAAPTPGAGGAGVDTDTDPDPVVATTTTTRTTSASTERTNPATSAPQRSSGSSRPVYMTLPDITLDLSIDAPDYAYVRQPVTFSAEASGIGPTLINSLNYDWNFGDLHTESGETATHRFRYPGTYLVTVHGHYKRQEYVGRHEITILPVTISLTRNQAGDLQLNNDSRYEVDLSGYTAVGSRELTLPPNTIVLPQQTITIPGYRIGGTATLHKDDGTVVTSEGAELALTPVSARPQASFSAVTSPSAQSGASVEPVTLPEVESTAPVAPEEENQAPALITIPAAEAAADAASAPANPLTNPRWPYALLAVILGVASLTVLLRTNQP